MINARGYNAVIYCDCCQKELAEGPYPADAEDNLPPECWKIVDEDKGPIEHYCAQCYADQINISLNATTT